MILAVDIGNTTVSLGVIRRQRVFRAWKIGMPLSQSGFRIKLREALSQIKRQFRSLEGVVICSVVPGSLILVDSMIQKELRIKPVIVGRDVKVPIKNYYHKPSRVGQDRLVCAYAAKKLYGCPVVIVDSGTAITLDVISSKGDYLGGIIVPGIRLSIESLYRKTALLPNIRVERPRNLIGRDTKNSILSGLFFGYGALCDGLIDQISKKIKKKPFVVGTGGYASIIRGYSRKIKKINNDLVFQGLYMTFQEVSGK